MLLFDTFNLKQQFFIAKTNMNTFRIVCPIDDQIVEECGCSESVLEVWSSVDKVTSTW
jgi:hypothetical protein